MKPSLTQPNTHTHPHLSTTKAIPFIIAVGVAMTLGGCTPDNSSQMAPSTSSEVLVGSDKDPHGCIGSAGYQWCGHTQKCERSWELAKKVGIENTTEAFENYCQQK